ncbi:MAG: sugar ABC transporter permease, partial [Arthrobacter sp.]
MTVKLQQPPVNEGRKLPSSTGGRAPKRRRLLTMAKARPWLLLAPALILLAGLLLWPLARVFIFS